ncbi:MAG: hypothetical protein KKH28_02985 [Elusimicrobia bacterium]|nr:hypothetical protein [Elusimicrobiota bacterium]
MRLSIKRYSGESRYHDARKEEGRRRLSVAARDLYRLVERFKGNAAVEKLNEYGLMKRLLSEQCGISDRPEPPAKDDDDGGEPPVPIKLKAPKEVESASLQTPHDEDVTYSGHKGKGYEVQIAESCVESNPVELITEAQVTPSSGSAKKALFTGESNVRALLYRWPLYAPFHVWRTRNSSRKASVRPPPRRGRLSCPGA